MALKRKRHKRTGHTVDGAKRIRLTPEIKSPVPLRKSARLQNIESKKVIKKEQSLQLPSPSTGSLVAQYTSRKRKYVPESVESVRSEASYSRPSKKPEISQQTPDQPGDAAHNPIAYWARTSSWPEDFGCGSFTMSEPPSNKRKSESTHRSETMERLAAHGILMENSNLISNESKKLCDQYLKTKWRVIMSSIFTAKEFSRVLDRVRNLNEARIQRDVTPWVVPSAEVLFFRGEHSLNWLGEELNAEWIRCFTMGSTKPKPDYTVGLLRKAFTEEEIKKLENYATPLRPFYFTPELCFPFLICEAKTGENGMNKADRQNIHSASIAVNAIIMLYREAFQSNQPDLVRQLHGQVLVFTVSHDNDRVFLYGHFAVADVESWNGLKFYRYPIALFSLTTKDGADRNKAYNFIRHVYEKFAPAHLKRIKVAVERLPLTPARTGLSFAASDLGLDQADSQQDSQDGVFKKPEAPSSASQINKLLQQLERQRQDSKEQMEQQRQHMEQQLEQQLERQRQDSKEQMEQQRQHMEQQLERQLEMMRQQMEQQKEVISLLKGSTRP